MHRVSEEEEEVDLYALLDVDGTATLKEIQKSYRRKALTCHPDKHKDDPVKGMDTHKKQEQNPLKQEQ